MQRKNKTAKQPPRKQPSWYERIWARVGLQNTNPELEPYLNADKFPDHQKALAEKLLSRNLSLTPLKELAVLTPEKLGLVLGQQCANLHALGEYFETLEAVLNDKDKVKQGQQVVETWRKHRHLPGVSSALHSGRVFELMILELAKGIPHFGKTLDLAFEAALNQPNWLETVAFFEGFTQGLKNPAIKDGALVRQSTTTPLQLKMFLHPEHAQEMGTVGEFGAFLSKSGLTAEEIGTEDRFRKFCDRIGYAPGSKKNKASKKKS